MFFALLRNIIIPIIKMGQTTFFEGVAGNVVVMASTDMAAVV